MRIPQSAKIWWYNGERPSRSAYYLVTVEISGKRRTMTSFYSATTGAFDISQRVLAWAKLPAPYNDKIFDKRPCELWPVESDFGRDLYNRKEEN